MSGVGSDVLVQALGRMAEQVRFNRGALTGHGNSRRPIPFFFVRCSIEGQELQEVKIAGEVVEHLTPCHRHLAAYLPDRQQQPLLVLVHANHHEK